MSRSKDHSVKRPRVAPVGTQLHPKGYVDKKACFRAKTLEIKLKRPHQLMMEVESETLSRANPSLFLFFSEVGTIFSL